MKVNKIEVFPHNTDWYSYDLNKRDCKIGDICYSSNESSYFYPNQKGRLLEYCKSDDLKNSPGFDDWAEVPIESIDDEMSVVDYWWNIWDKTSKEDKPKISKNIPKNILEKILDLYVQKYL